MSQVTNYSAPKSQSSELEHNKSPKTTHYFWKMCTWICCCCSQTQVQAEETFSPKELLNRALESASRQLKLTVQVVETSPLQGRDYLLEIIGTDLKEPIDIISPHNPDESLKSMTQLAAEIQKKVHQHLGFKELAMKRPDHYLITKEGCKIELSGILSSAKGPNGEAFLKYGDQTIKYGGKDFDFNRAHSYTAIATQLLGRIRMYDDYDEIRTDGKKGFFISIDKELPDYMTIVRQ